METATPKIWIENSDFSDEDSETVLSDSERFGEWDTLPDVVLLHIFRCLSDVERSRAAQVCHHWYLMMRSPCLWRTRCFWLNGHLSKYKQSEYSTVVGYIHSQGVFLEKLEVTVYPPNTIVLARRLQSTIWGMFNELVSVRAPLQSLFLVGLELDGYSWTRVHRISVVIILIYFLRRGASKLKYLCLNGMRNDMRKGLDVLSEILKYQRAFSPRGRLSFLDLRDFFSTHFPTSFNSRMTHIVQKLQGLTYLGLSYSCLSDELIMVLCQSHRGGGWNSGRSGNILQTLSLRCTQRKPYHQLVCSHSWATLASSCPGLKVHISMEQVINTNFLEKILLPEIPLRKFDMSAFYSSDEHWSVKPILCHMLPLYRHSLQYLTLDVSNCIESMDDELLELVTMCKCLVDLRVWALLDVLTVERLLHMRLTQNFSLNKIQVRIYSMSDNITVQKDELKSVLSTYEQRFPPELQVQASVIPLI